MKTGETHRRQELREDAGRAARRRCVRWRSPSADGAPQTGGTSRIN